MVVVVQAQDLVLEVLDHLGNAVHNAIRNVGPISQFMDIVFHDPKALEYPFGADVGREHSQGVEVGLKLVCGEGTDVWKFMLNDKLPGQKSPDLFNSIRPI